MKKLMGLILCSLTVIAFAGCQKKETAEAPMEQPIISEQQAAPAAGAAATSTFAAEPVASTAVGSMTAAATAVTEAATAAVEQAASTAAAIEKPTPQQIQQALKNAGIYSGKVDGSIGPKTKKAIEEFQAQNGLTADGKVGAKTWAKLGTHLTGTAAAVATEPIMPTDTSATGTTSAEPAN